VGYNILFFFNSFIKLLRIPQALLSQAPEVKTVRPVLFITSQTVTELFLTASGVAE
jgi:hypothetical protein